MGTGCGESTNSPFLFQVFIWPRETSAVLGQKQERTLSGCQGVDASPACGDVSAAESSATGEGERLPLLKGFQENIYFFFFCKTFESDLITVKFSFLTICCINLRVLHS